jgi:hypothetical protein
MKRSDTDEFWIKMKVFNKSYCLFCNKKWEYGCDFGLCQVTATSTPKI